LTGYLDDGTIPADNNFLQNPIRFIAPGRSEWRFCGSLRAGQRAAAIKSLVQSARMNDVDSSVYLKDVFTRLLTLSASRIEELLTHRWVSAAR
jgi:transposase